MRITISNRSVYSGVKFQTNNPKWNNTLILPEIFLYSHYANIIENPPEILLEIFDQDIVGGDEFMGRCYLKPFINNTFFNPPRLKWYKIFHGNERAGMKNKSFVVFLT